jgi:hypothetical protein
MFYISDVYIIIWLWISAINSVFDWFVKKCFTGIRPKTAVKVRITFELQNFFSGKVCVIM